MSLPCQLITLPVEPPAAALRKTARFGPAGGRGRWLAARRVWLGALALAVGLIGFGRGEVAAVYRHWRFINTLLLGHRWLEAGRFERVADSVRQALALDAKRPEPWRLASELAWRRAQPGKAVEYATKAAGASGYRIEYVLDWAALAMGYADLTAAEQALSHVPPEDLRNSARALRLAAQLAGRRGNYLAARDRLSAILALDLANRSPDLLSDQAQQGKVLLQTGQTEDRRQGLELLERCARDRGLIGRFALRVLVADSVSNPNGSSTLKWTQALLSHPLCSLDDSKFCLRAAAPRADDAFGTVFAAVRSKLATSQLRSAELLEWLGQCGRTKEALEWARAVNSADVTAPPLFVAVAETFRQTAQWRDLESWTGLADWGSGVGLIQSTYRWMALSQLGEPEAAAAAAGFAKLKAAAPAAGSETMMAAQLLYTWGQSDRAVELLWLLSDDPQLNVRALGMLIRHYQTKRDGKGLHRAFEAWCRQHPDDRTAAASCALFGSLSGAGDSVRFEQLVANSLSFDPSNEYLRSCSAVVWAVGGRGDRALAALAPIVDRWKNSHSIAFAYGLSLAAAGRTAEAREVLRTLDPTTMTVEQAARCAAVLHQ